MILKDKTTNRTWRITRKEFFLYFAGEIEQAIKKYQNQNFADVENKLITMHQLTLNFFANIDTNFNDFSNTAWLIERL